MRPQFDRLVAQIAKDARRRKTLIAADYYPPINKKSGGQTRELLLADSALLEAISRVLDERMTLKKPLKSNATLLLSQIRWILQPKYAAGSYGHDAA